MRRSGLARPPRALTSGKKVVMATMSPCPLPCLPLRRFCALMLLAASLAMPTRATAQQVRIRQLTNIAFGTMGAVPADRSLTDNLCVYSTAASGRYTITARGSGSAGAFALASGGNTLAYEVQWASSANQSSGTALSPNVALAATTTNRTDSTCTLAASQTATLIVVLRADTQQSARAGSYSGTLTLVVAPN